MGSEFGYGQQDPNSTSDEFNKIDFQTRQLIARMATTRLVQVMKVTGGAGAIGAAGTVDVLPLVSQIDGGGNVTKHGTVYGIPWFRLQGGKNAVICDPEVGDVGYVAVSDRDISSVKANPQGGPVAPGSLRKFDLADGIYVGGCLNVGPDQYLVFTATGVRIVDKNGNSIAMDSSGITATDLTGNVVSTSASGINLTPHTGLPVTITGDLVVTGNTKIEMNLQLGGAFQGVAGATYPSDLQVAGNIVAGVGTADQVDVLNHNHNYSPGTGPATGITGPPRAGT